MQEFKYDSDMEEVKQEIETYTLESNSKMNELTNNNLALEEKIKNLNEKCHGLETTVDENLNN